MFKKILLSVIAFIILFQGSVAPVLAAEQWYDSGIIHWYVKVYNTDVSQPQEIYGERYTAAQVQWVIYSLIVLPMNMIFDSEFTACVLGNMESHSPVLPCFNLDAIINVFHELKDLVISLITLDQTQPQNLAEMVFSNRSLSGVTYFQNIVRKINLTPVVHAQQGYGYGALEILQPLWQKSRDLAYGLLIFAAIIMAFLIMFRSKVSPQAVITVQSAIPKLIGAIILITFSYAIAGLLVDLMYVVIGLLASILSPSQDIDSVSKIYKIMTDGPMNAGLLGMFLIYVQIFPSFFVAALLGGAGAAGTVIAAVLNFIPMFQLIVPTISLIITIIMFFVFFKALFMLIKTLVNIYLLVIFGPLYVLGGTITPALSFGSWVQDLVANLAVYPAVGVMFVFSLTFLQAAVTNISSAPGFSESVRNDTLEIFGALVGNNGLPAITDNGWGPPLLSLGESAGGLLLLFVSLSIMTLIPKIADMIKGFMSGKPFPYGSGIGEALSAAGGFAAGVAAAPGRAINYGANAITGAGKIAAGLTAYRAATGSQQPQTPPPTQVVRPQGQTSQRASAASKLGIRVRNSK